MTPHKHRQASCFLCLAAILAQAGLAVPAVAQVSSLDKTKFIEGLREQGMGELLQHLITTEKLDDPILARQASINVDLLEYTDKGRLAGRESDPARGETLRAEALAAFDRALAARRQLIKDFYDNEQRPLWQTDLAQQLLWTQLPEIYRNAAEFYELGVPTEAQRKAFETAVPEAVTQMLDANNRFFVLMGDIPRRPDYEKKFVFTGLWPRMKDEYYDLRTKYFLALAAYDATLLPDSSPYFQNLGKDPRIGQLQKKTPAEERQRLLTLAIDNLDKFVRDLGDQHDIRRPSMLVTARALMAQGKLPDAMAMLELVIAGKNDDLIQLVASIVKAKGLDKSKHTDDAIALLNELQTVPPASKNLEYRLLVVDQTHLILLAHAQAQPPATRAKALAEAYEPYLTLLNDPALGNLADDLKNYIYRRWEQSIPPGAKLDDIPDAVVGAIGEMARTAGADLQGQAAGATDPKTAADLNAQAKAKLERAVQVNTVLLKRTTLTPTVRAQGMFNQALAIYLLAPDSLESRTTAAMIFVDMADQFPEQSMSETSIGEAVTVLRKIFDLPTRPAGITEKYEKAVKVLLTKYPTSKAADAERLPYAQDVLVPAGRFAEASGVLKQILPDAPDYWAAQRLLVYSSEQVFKQAKGDQVKPAADEAIAQGQRILRESTPALQAATKPDLQKTIRQAAAWSRLVLADMAADYEQNIDKALGILATFDKDYADEKELIQFMLERRIGWLLKVNKVDAAVAEAAGMMAQFPDSGAPVVDQVLTVLDQQMEELRKKAGAELVEADKQQMLAEIKQKADAAVKLARMLHDWAGGQKFTDEQLLPFDLIYIKSLRMSGQNKEAIALVEPLNAKFPNDAKVILNEAEARFALGDPEDLVKAAVLFDKIREGIRPKGNIYPDIWWNAWLRRLQIMDKLNKSADEIPMLVQQLESRDPKLGGDAFYTEFKRLQQAHSSK